MKFLALQNIYFAVEFMMKDTTFQIILPFLIKSGPFCANPDQILEKSPDPDQSLEDMEDRETDNDLWFSL